MQLIKLTGKETKKEIISLLIAGGACFERYGVCDERWYRNDDKAKLLTRVKIYNANIFEGGNGNISEWKNEEAYSHSNEVDLRVIDWLATEGITPENMKDFIPQEIGLKMMGDYRQYKKKEHNDFIGHTPEEKEKAFMWLKSQFEKELARKLETTN